MMDERLQILRSYEALCYRICFCLLESEKLAVETAKLALWELVQDAEFFRCPQKEKQERIRKIAVEKSLSAYYSGLA